MLRAAFVGLAVLVPFVTACDRSTAREPESQPAPVPKPPPTAATALSSRLSRAAPEKVVAIGDLHGDLEHARRALHLAGAIDEHDRWAGGRLVVVQTGDEIDRGDDDRAILDAVERWKREAAAAGGELIALLGNHEIMNASLDFRYVTARGFEAFSSPAAPPAAASQLPPLAFGRAAAFAPGGPYATLEAGRPLVVKLGDTVFVHGGILPKHMSYGLDRMNDQLDDWLAGKRPAPPEVVVAEDGPVWTRKYSSDTEAPDCGALADVLAGLGAKRMVVGHTVQRQGVNEACGGAVWRIDVGLSRAYGGPIQALAIEGEKVRILNE